MRVGAGEVEGSFGGSITFASCFGCRGLEKTELFAGGASLECGCLELFPVLKLERSISQTVPPQLALLSSSPVPVLLSLSSDSFIFVRKSPAPEQWKL